MMVLHGGTHIDRDEEERSARVVTYFAMRDALSTEHVKCMRLVIL